MFNAGRGVGALLSGPVSEVLIGYGGFEGARGAYYGVYGAVIVFTGGSALDGFVCFGVWRRGV
jgi:hypothetical protein